MAGLGRGRFIDLSGNKFNRLYVIERLPGNQNGNTIWKCLCDCGNTVTVIGASLRNGNTKSCGCLQRETVSEGKFALTHGKTNSPEYTCHSHMIQRCYNPKDKGYPWYGEKGITVCDRWLYGEGGKTGFECFYEDMEEKPIPKTLYSIHRINIYGNYETGNCKWATDKEQNGVGNRKPRPNKTGYTEVYEKRGRYDAYVRGKFIGTYHTPQEASLARDRAKQN